MRLVAMSWTLGLVVLAIAGCNEVTPPTTASFDFTVKSWEPPPYDSVPVEGAWLCEMDTRNCELTNANGEATLMLPIGETAVTSDKEGYSPRLVPLDVPANGGWERVTAVTAQYIADGHDRVGSPYPMRGTGAVSVAVDPTRFAGVTFELVAATGVPWYMDEESNWRADPAATTSKGIGGFTEVTPGEVQVRVGGAGDRCVAHRWPGDEPSSVRLPVREGYVTHTNVDCPPP